MTFTMERAHDVAMGRADPDLLYLRRPPPQGPLITLFTSPAKTPTTAPITSEPSRSTRRPWPTGRREMDLLRRRRGDRLRSEHQRATTC